MVEKELQAESNRGRTREPPSVPFLWEERPGIPKKDWGKPETPSVTPVMTNPFKLIDSVPFLWEQQPETQLISFSPPPEQTDQTPYLNLMDSPLPLPPALAGGYGKSCFEFGSDDDHPRGHDEDDDDSDGEQEEAGFESDMESISFKTGRPSLVMRVPSRPVKLVASVPFMWEEKPGTPLPSFSWHMSETDAPAPQANLLLLPKSSYHRQETNHAIDQAPVFTFDSEPPIYNPVKPSSVTRALSRPVKFIASIPFSWEEKPGKPLPTYSWQLLRPDQTTPRPSLIKVSISRGNNSHYDEMFELDVGSFSFERDESFSSGSSLLANCLVPSSAISTAIPVQSSRIPSMDENDNYLELETTSSQDSDTDNSTSSYETEASSFVGASFLEWLFPHFPPKSEIHENNGSCERVPLNPPALEAGKRDFSRVSNGSFAIRRPATLGELIMMSRRRSYRRKAVQMRKQNLSTHEFAKKSNFGCFGTGGRKLIEGLHLKHHLRLKLM